MNRIFLSGALFLIAGCATDAEDSVLGTAEQNATGFAIDTLVIDGAPHSADFDEGPITDRTCFLMGVGGSLKFDYDVTYSADAGPYLGGLNEWVLEDWPAATDAILKVRGQCVGVTANRTDEFTWDPQHDVSPKILAPYSATTACFIEQVKQSRLEPDNSLFSTNDDTLRVTHDANHWYLSGTGGGAGSARCITVTARDPEVRGNSNTLTFLTNQTGHQCFLTGIEGAFRSTDRDDGVFVSYDSTTTTRSLAVSPGKTGWATCMN